MGQVYLGRSSAGRLVAVKTIRVELAEEAGFRTRFAQEVAAARRVSGVFTAAVVEADPDADLPWLATAYVPAPSLSLLVEACGPLPVPGGPLARRRVRGGAGVDPPRRAGAPRPEAVERAGRAGRPAGDRLRRGPGGRAHGAHHLARRRRHARLHGAGAGPGRHLGLGGQRRVLARRDAGFRRDRAPALPGRHRHGRPGPARDRAARPVRPARPNSSTSSPPACSGCRGTARRRPRCWPGSARSPRASRVRPGALLPARAGDGPDRASTSAIRCWRRGRQRRRGG